MQIYFAKQAKREYDDFKKNNNKQIIKKINELLESILDDGCLSGIGNPEVLKYYLPKAYSRRKTKEHRLVYRLSDDTVYVLSCYGHYQL